MLTFCTFIWQCHLKEKRKNTHFVSQGRLTCLADSTSIFMMATGRCIPAVKGAAIYTGLSSVTSQAVENRKFRVSLSKLSFSWKPDGLWESQLSADHICLLFLPVIVTNGPPLTLTEYLHPSAATIWSAYQAKGFCFSSLIRCRCKARKQTWQCAKIKINNWLNIWVFL